MILILTIRNSANIILEGLSLAVCKACGLKAGPAAGKHMMKMVAPGVIIKDIRYQDSSNSVMLMENLTLRVNILTVFVGSSLLKKATIVPAQSIQDISN